MTIIATAVDTAIATVVDTVDVVAIVVAPAIVIADVTTAADATAATVTAGGDGDGAIAAVNVVATSAVAGVLIVFAVNEIVSHSVNISMQVVFSFWHAEGDLSLQNLKHFFQCWHNRMLQTDT